MKLKNLITFLYTMICGLVLVLVFTKINTSPAKSVIETENERKTNMPYSLQLYEAIEKFTKKYSIPKEVAYNVAYRETGYRGPFDWRYNPHQKSFAGAVGPMQIITRYAHHYAGRKVTEQELKTNIPLNVEVSMRMLRELHNRYGSWSVACGYYNTGYPIVNDYGAYCASIKNYQSKWNKI